MLKKELRLKTEDFKSLPKAQRYHTDNFTISYILGHKQNGQKSRFAVVAPKKLYKLAVYRNKAKRLAYSSLETIKDNLNTKFEKVFIFIKKDILNKDKNQILEEINSVLKLK
jgi:ribonuclease P protein component